MESAANEFFVGFTRNSEGGPPTLQFFVSTPEPNPVSFTVTASGFRFSGVAISNSATVVNLPNTFQVQSTSERNKGIHIKAEQQRKLVVYGLSYHQFTSDAFLALPCNSLAVDEYEYYGMIYPDRRPQLTSDILIVGCENSTVVTTPSGTVILNQLETYLIQRADTTGMRITSTKPVSFFSNHECTDVPINRPWCDHLTEQLPPTSTWGTSFFLANLEGRRSGEVIRIIAAEASATVRVNCTTFSQVQVFSLSAAGNWRELQINPPSFCNIESSVPILVTQFASGYHIDSVGDPFMMIIPPVEQYSNNYVLNVLSSFSTNFITIYVAARYYQPERIFVDSTSQINSAWTAVYCSSGTICGYITRVSLSAGEHRLYHQDSNAKVGVSAYGFNAYNSYGYPGGIELTPVQCEYIFYKYSIHNAAIIISVATVSFSAASYRVSEGAESLELNITRSGDTSILAVVMVASDNLEGTASGLILW